MGWLRNLKSITYESKTHVLLGRNRNEQGSKEYNVIDKTEIHTLKQMLCEDGTLHETIRNDTPVRFYFVLNLKQIEQRMHLPLFEKTLQIIIDKFKQYYGIDLVKEDFCCLKTRDPENLTYHVIVKNKIYAINSTEVKNFASHVSKYIMFYEPERLLTQKTLTIVNLTVYKNDCCVKMVNQSNHEKNANISKLEFLNNNDKIEETLVTLFNSDNIQQMDNDIHKRTYKRDISMPKLKITKKLNVSVKRPSNQNRPKRDFSKWRNRCKNEWCTTQANKKVNEGFCLPCFVNEYPNRQVHINYKTKEFSVVSFVKTRFPELTWITDKAVTNGCSNKRPDMLLKLDNFVLIIEIDEYKHNSHTCSCENKRMMEISEDLRFTPTLFLRFNPDCYTTNDKLITSCWGLDGNGMCVVKHDKKQEWYNRLNTLCMHIEHYIQPQNHVTKTLEVMQLFYDGYYQ